MVSIIDVAREAGCSISTVSYALSGKRAINPVTRKHILAICSRLDYIPNAAARNLRSQRTEVIGLLLYPTCVSQFRNSFATEVIEGIEQGLIEAKHHLLVAGCQPHLGSGTVPAFMAQGLVDAVILLGDYTDDILLRLDTARQPLLLLDADIEHLSINSLTTDGFSAGRQAVDYLVEYGHRAIAMLGYARSTTNARARQLGFQNGVRRHGLGDPINLTIADNTAHEDAVAKILARLQHATPLTALFCENDTMALAIMAGLQRAGIDVPRQLSIIGFNDDDVASQARPGLTTFRIDKRELGKQGVELILDIIAQPAKQISKRRIPVQLVERASVTRLHPTAGH